MVNPFAHSKPETGSSFLPEDYVTKKADVRSNMICLGLFVVVMFGVASAFLVTNRQWASVKDEHKAINAAYESEAKKIEQLKSLESQRESMLERAEITVALVEKSPRSVMMASLVTSMPEGVTLLEAELASKRVTAPVSQKAAEVKSLSGSKKSSKKSSKSSKSKTETPEPPKPQAPKFETTLRLTGVATANEQIADYVTKLKLCDTLEAVELTYIKETIMAEMTLRKFQVDAKVKAGTKLFTEGAQASATDAASTGTGTPAQAGAEPTTVQPESAPVASATEQAPAPDAAPDPASEKATGISRRSPAAIAKSTTSPEPAPGAATAGVTPEEED
jgi:Tfp pilus assembly protein PilN